MQAKTFVHWTKFKHKNISYWKEIIYVVLGDDKNILYIYNQKLL